MQLKIITQEREVVSTTVSRVVLPGASGQMEVLPGHSKLAALLVKGEVSYFEEGAEKLDIEGGLCEVADDKICLLIYGKAAQ